MKKVFLVLGFLVLAGLAYATPKWVPTYYSSNSIVTSSRTILHDVAIYYFGVTVGDRILLKNGTSTAASAVYVYVAPTANGAFYFDPEKDLVIDQGLYVEILKTGGTFGVGLTYQ